MASEARPNTPRPNTLRKRDAVSILHPNSDAIANERDGALVIARGKGVHVWNETDKEYIEGIAGLSCVSLGFGNERLARVAADGPAHTGS